VIIGEKHDFDADRHGSDFEHMNCYYMRDRGEKDQGPKTYSDEADYLENGFNTGEEYIYLAKNTGQKDYLGNEQVTWFYSHYENPQFKPLEEDAIKDHIDMLQRHLEMMKERKAA